MKNKYKLYLNYFLTHFFSISIGIWVLNSFEFSDSYLKNLFITAFLISAGLSWYTVQQKIKALKKHGLKLSDECLTKKFRKRIQSEKSPDEILLEIIENYKPKKIKVSKIDEGFKIYIKILFLNLVK